MSYKWKIEESILQKDMIPESQFRSGSQTNLRDGGASVIQSSLLIPPHLLQAMATDNSIVECVIWRKLELPSKLMEYLK